MTPGCVKLTVKASQDSLIKGVCALTLDEFVIFPRVLSLDSGDTLNWKNPSIGVIPGTERYFYLLKL